MLILHKIIYESIISSQDVDQYFINESRKEEEVMKVRLENIKLKNKLKKKEQQLKSKEELAEGLHMIDFEQLKIENQTYNEKIEERNEVRAAAVFSQRVYNHKMNGEIWMPVSFVGKSHRVFAD